MKYIITESKINDAIKKIVLEEFPIVNEVRFTKLTVMLGSTKGIPKIDRTVIWLILDNSNNQYNRSQLMVIKKDIRNKINGIFGLRIEDYESEWDIEFRQIAIVSLDATLSNIK